VWKSGGTVDNRGRPVEVSDTQRGVSVAGNVDPFTHVSSGYDGLEFTPCVTPVAGGGGGEFAYGEIAVLREVGHAGNPHLAGFWRAEPSVSPLYDVPFGDESGYVIAGSATIEFVDSGEKLELKAGQMYSLTKGTLQRWTVHETFIKFVVAADCQTAQQ
jgi:uncharacterized cupin superfamily protein